MAARWSRLGATWLAAAGCALVAGCAADKETVQGVNWAGPMATPNGQEWTPERALKRGEQGWAVLRCTMGPDRKATDCAVWKESPPGQGYGVAALRMAAKVEVNSHALAPGARFRIPILFCQPDRPDCHPRLMEEVRAASAGQPPP